MTRASSSLLPLRGRGTVATRRWRGSSTGPGSDQHQSRPPLTTPSVTACGGDSSPEPALRAWGSSKMNDEPSGAFAPA